MTFAVRPEAVRLWLEPPSPRPLNLLEGTVVEAIYEGGSRRWSVELPTGERVIVRESNDTGDAVAGMVSRGRKVYLSWDPARSLVYPADR